MPSPPGSPRGLRLHQEVRHLWRSLPDNKGLRFISSKSRNAGGRGLKGQSQWPDLSRQQRPCCPGGAQRLDEGRGDRSDRALRFDKTALRIGREFANASQRVKAEGSTTSGAACWAAIAGRAVWRGRTPAAGSCRSRRSPVNSVSRGARRSRPCSSWPNCARPSSPACHRCWRSRTAGAACAASHGEGGREESARWAARAAAVRAQPG